MHLGVSYRSLSRKLQQCPDTGNRRRDHHPCCRFDSFSFNPSSSHPWASQRLDPKQRYRIEAVQQSNISPAIKGGTIHLPIEYVQFLGLYPGDNVKETQVLSAFGRLSAAQLEEGFSARAMAGRQQLLEEAKEEALKLVEKSYNPESTKGIDLPSHLLPGGLSLLMEVGQYDLVMSIGSKILQSSDVGNMKRDILLSMAMAKLNQASESFTVPNQHAMAFTRMTEALNLLKDGGAPELAPVLSNEIEHTIGNSVPCRIVNQLKLPLSEENSKGRREAIGILQGLLSVPIHRDFASVRIDRHYVKQVMDCLTSREVLESMDWERVLSDPKLVEWYYPGLLLKGAAVHIVVGFVERKPAFLGTLDSILSLPGKDREAHVEHVICKVLLGEVEQALQILDEIEGSNERLMSWTSDENGDDEFMSRLSDQSIVGAKLLPGRNEIFAFVKANSAEESEDYLRGLVLFVERWLQYAGFTQFMDISARPPPTSLADYFNSGKVDSFLSSDTGSQKKLFGGILNNKKTTKKLQSSRFLRQEQSDHDVSSKEGSFTPPSRLEGAQYGRRKVGYWSRLKSQINPATLGAFLGIIVAGPTVYFMFPSPKIQQPASPTPVQVAKKTPEVEEKPQIAQETKTKTKEKSSSRHPNRSLASLKKKDAETLIKKWQIAKAEALGPNHEVRLMSKVLVNPLLSKWTSNIQEIQERGLFCRCRLDHCKVTGIKTLASKEQKGVVVVVVNATLKERNTMYGSSGKPVDEYNSRYNVGYHVILDEKGRWKIKDIEILKSKR